MAKKSDRRKKIRDELWPDAHGVTYWHKSESGFFTIPRTLPMIASLTKVLSPKIDPSRVYLELWSRSFDPPGFVEITDEEDCANSAGFYGKGRALRTWRERVDALEQLGFIRVAPKGTKDRAFVLLLHPHQVVRDLREAKKIQDWWWSVFTSRLHAIGGVLPAKPDPSDVLPF